MLSTQNIKSWRCTVELAVSICHTEYILSLCFLKIEAICRRTTTNDACVRYKLFWFTSRYCSTMARKPIILGFFINERHLMTETRIEEKVPALPCLQQLLCLQTPERPENSTERTASVIEISSFRIKPPGCIYCITKERACSRDHCG